MSLPWYLRKSPTIFCVVAAIKFLENGFTIIGFSAWSHEHGTTSGVAFLTILKLLDISFYAFGWLATAILAKLLLLIFDRVSSSHA